MASRICCSIWVRLAVASSSILSDPVTYMRGSYLNSRDYSYSGDLSLILTRRWSSVWAVVHNAAHNVFLTFPAYASSRELEAPHPVRRRHILHTGVSVLKER